MELPQAMPWWKHLAALQLSSVCSGVGTAQGPCLRSWAVFLGHGAVLSSPTVMGIGGA